MGLFVKKKIAEQTKQIKDNIVLYIKKCEASL